MNFPGLTLVLLGLSACCTVHAQQNSRYTPRTVYSEKSKELIHAIKEQTGRELDKMGARRGDEIRSVYNRRLDYLVGLIRQDRFIHDDSLERYVNSVFNRILAHNALSQSPGKVLIMKEAAANAVCYGEGTFILTIGLLSRLKNEDQLAFTLCHELAHFELEHVKKRIERLIDDALSKEAKQAASRINSGAFTLENLEAVKKWIYQGLRYTRALEVEADSLGFVFFRNAAYRQDEALSLLSVLDSVDMPKYLPGPALFSPLDFTDYPFQVHWLHDRLSVFSNKPSDTFLFAQDSLKTHPDIALRKEAVKTYIGEQKQPAGSGYLPPAYADAIIEMADFESVESAYFNKQHDRCLFLALQLRAVYPPNTYITTMIGKVLLELVEAREAETFSLYVPRFTVYYHDALRQVNNFLHNLRTAEIGELAFHFLNHQDNFDRDEEEHYYLLWKICAHTYRKNVQDKIREVYKNRFPQGKYLQKMKWFAR